MNYMVNNIWVNQTKFGDF